MTKKELGFAPGSFSINCRLISALLIIGLFCRHY